MWKSEVGMRNIYRKMVEGMKRETGKISKVGSRLESESEEEILLKY